MVLIKIINDTNDEILLINGSVDIIPIIIGIWEKDNNWKVLRIFINLYSLFSMISFEDVIPIRFLFAKNETPRK